MLRALIAAGLLVMTGTARAQAPLSAGACTEDGRPIIDDEEARKRSGLPTLGTMTLTAGGALGLFAVFSAVAGSVLVVERAVGTPQIAGGLALVGVIASGLAATGFVLIALGAAIWVAAWVPLTPQRPCPPTG